jgi:hypothetical protein
MNPFVTRVATGRHLAARTAVLYGATSFHCVIYRRKLIDMPNNTSREESAWGGIGQLSPQDEHAYEPEKVGMARIKFALRQGGMMLANDSNQIGDTDTYVACIEPYDDAAPKMEWPKQVFDWKIEDGDVVMIVPTWMPKPFYYEVAGVMATGVVPDFGKRYLLNSREELSYEPLQSE